MVFLEVTRIFPTQRAVSSVECGLHKTSRIDSQKLNNFGALRAGPPDCVSRWSSIAVRYPHAMGQAVDDGDQPANARRQSVFDGRAKRGRRQRQTAAPLGNLIVKAMKLLDLSYKD